MPKILRQLSWRSEVIGARVVSKMAVVATMGIIVPEKPFSPSNINKTVFYPLRLPWIHWDAPDFNFHQGPIGFDNSPVSNEVSLWYIGSLTPYILECKRKARKRGLNETGNEEQASPGLLFAE